MQTLSATLVAAQKSRSLVPYVKVETWDETARVKILSWSRWYTGTEADSPHAAWVSGDGSLIRARATGGKLYVQRVANPTAESDYSAWIELAVGIHASSPVALCGVGSIVALFYVDAAGTGVKYRASGENGASWTDEVAAGVAGGTVSQLAAVSRDASNLVVFLSVGGTVSSLTYADGWGAVTAWTNVVKTVTGLAAFYGGDYNLVVTGTDTTDSCHVWTTIFGDNYSYAVGDWGPLVDVVTASAGTGVEYHQPAVGFPDVYRLWYLEKYTGTVAYSRPYWSHGIRGAADYASNVWREPVPFDLSSTRGLSMAYSSPSAEGQVFVTASSGVWRAALSSTVHDLTGDVLELNLHEGERAGRAVVTLRNDDGRYNAGGSFAEGLGKGWQLEVSLGARTTEGNETGTARLFWIQSWRRSCEARRAVIVLEAVDAWGLLELWRARRHLSWTAGSMTRFQLLQAVVGFVGLELASIGSLSSEMSADQPAFAIAPGESGATAVRRLLDQVPEVLFWRQATGYVKSVSASDSASYAYGTDHVIYRGEAMEEAYRVNRVQVFGAGTYGEEQTWDEIAGVGDRLTQVVDLNLNTADRVNGRAAAVKRKWELAATPTMLVTPVSCGVELYDVVTVTESRLGLSTAKRRVRGYTVRYARSSTQRGPERRGLWEMDLVLGGA
ncbi:MAG: hypothetical protein EPO21_11800 [Chloroflexota bacterium]|nr:MAG: hypothetical protein EPO21_11800 [Chloroflexota bacterium]